MSVDAHGYPFVARSGRLPLGPKARVGTVRVSHRRVRPPRSAAFSNSFCPETSEYAMFAAATSLEVTSYITGASALAAGAIATADMPVSSEMSISCTRIMVRSSLETLRSNT